MKEGWKEKRLGDVCNISSMLIDPRKDEFLDLIHVGAGNIEAQTGILIELKTAREEGLISGKFLFDESMVLYSKIRPYLMKVVRPEFSGMCSADIYPLTPLPNEITRDYLFYLLLCKHFTDYAIEGSARAGMPKVNRDHLFDFRVCLPDVKKQKELTSKLDEAFDGIATAKANAKQNLRNARELFESHLQSVFTQRGEGWVETPLAEVCDIKHGFAFDGVDFSNGVPEGNPIVITPGNFTDDGKLLFNEKNTKRFSGVPPTAFRFNVGDLVVVMTDLSSKMKILGKPAFVEADNVLHNQRIGRAVFFSSAIKKRFVYYFMMSERFLNNIRESSTGTMVKHTAPKRILSNTIPFPRERQEQAMIIAKLDALREETQLLESIYQQKLAALDELKKSMLHKAFSGEL
ncbi:MAG: restriction endonuclease subunit S [Humidesulfovibrio sp.]